MINRIIYNNMKKIILLMVFTFLLASFSSAYAIERSETATPGANKLLQRQQAKGVVTDSKTTNLKERAAKEITRRLTSLNKLIEKINRLKKITDAQKSSFVSQIQTEITNLNTLKTKIDADTDLVTLKADVQPVIKSYRIYALFMPKIHILTAADELDNLSEKLSTIATKLETRIREANARGSDTTALNSLPTDIKSKISDTKTQAKNARNVILPLTPEGYPGNLIVLKAARTMLLTGKKDLQTARKDALTIIQGLKALNKISPTPTPTSTPTP